MRPPPAHAPAWRLAHFGDTADEGDAADLANPTGDGLPNLLKFALDLDPTVPAGGADRTVVDMVDFDGARVLKLRIPADLNRPELHYVLEMSRRPRHVVRPGRSDGPHHLHGHARRTGRRSDPRRRCG